MNRSADSDPPARLDWPLPDVARITLDRASKHNTLTLEMIAAIDEAVDRSYADKARVVIITGSGKTFCGGAYIKYFTEPGAPLAGDARAIRDQYVRPMIRTFRKLRDLPFVSIAAINGHALGGGCELALNCDFRLMAAPARIGLTEVRLGAMPAAGGLQLLSRIVGRAKALEIALLGDQWSAKQAAAAALVNAVYAPEALEDATFKLARRLLLCSPVSVGEVKRALGRCDTAGADEADEIALDALTAAAAGPEWWEGMEAFTDKRMPAFAANGETDGKAGLD